MRLSQSTGVFGTGAIARRRRSRKERASSRRERNAGDSGGNSRNASAATPQPDDDRQREIVELRRVVAHLVRGREERHEIERHGSKHALLQGHRLWAIGNARRDEEKTDGEAEGREGLEGRQQREFDDRCANTVAGGAERERDSAV